MPPKKKKISGYINLQIQAGAATRRRRSARARSARCQHHGVRQGVQRGDRAPARQHHPRRHHGLRRPHLRLHHQDAPGVRRQKAAGVQKGAGEPHKVKVGKLTKDQVREIAEVKMPDLNANDIDAAMKIIAGTARQMGITTELWARTGARPCGCHGIRTRMPVGRHVGAPPVAGPALAR